MHSIMRGLFIFVTVAIITFPIYCIIKIPSDYLVIISLLSAVMGLWIANKIITKSRYHHG